MEQTASWTAPIGLSGNQTQECQVLKASAQPVQTVIFQSRLVHTVKKLETFQEQCSRQRSVKN